VGDSRPDWKILCDLSAEMGYPMTYSGPAEVMDEIASLVPLYAGMTYPRLEGDGIQWSLRSDGKRTFFPVDYREPVERPDEAYPLWILPGGFHYHYGIGTSTKRAAGLARVYPDTCIHVHPEDAAKAGLKDGDPVRVLSRRGSVETLCRISEALPKGTAYVASTFYNAPVNGLLISGCDPVSRTPEYKVVAGRVEKR